MSEIDLKRDHLIWRRGLLIASTALLSALVFAGYRAATPPWRDYQTRFLASHGASRDTEPKIMQYTPCDGAVDRCPTCHTGIERKDLAKKAIPLPFRGHGPGLGNHDPAVVGCTACHGGNGRALHPVRSHVATETGARDPLMTAPHIQASCARCHLPGDKPGQERLAEGADLYAGLGCPVCHPLTDQGLGGFDYGPNLRAIGRKSPDYLETSLLEPARNFPGSTMPSFRLSLGKTPDALDSLVIYLESLVLPRHGECRDRDRSRALVTAPCHTCHAGTGGEAVGRRAHRCPYLIKRKDALRCSGCHPDAVPEPGSGMGFCPLIQQHRDACVVCHEGKDVPR